MAALNPPICDFEQPAKAFQLAEPNGKLWSLADCTGPKGLLIMFICNHCPFVQAILPELVDDAYELKKAGVNTVAIMPNDVQSYPDDAPNKMAELAAEAHFSFPYLFDESQEVAKAYGAVCTPDFFGYNSELKLQYRGRFDASGRQRTEPRSKADLLDAMMRVASTGQGPREQQSSIGCSIKWRDEL